MGLSTTYTKTETDFLIQQFLHTAYLGIATTTTTPPATGAYWYRVTIAGTYTNFLEGGSPIVVSAGDLDGNEVFFEVKDNVSTKRISAKEVVTESLNLYIKTGSAIYNYNDSSFRGWASLKKVENSSSVRYVRLMKRGASFATTGNFVIKIWGSNLINELQTELDSITIPANDFTSLNNFELFNIDFLNQNEITDYSYIGISIEGNEMPPIMQAVGTDIEGKGLYKINGLDEWILTADAVGYGLWWMASSDSNYPFVKKIIESLLPDDIISLRNKNHDLLNEIRQVANFQKENSIKTTILSQDRDVYLTLYGDSITAWQSTLVKPVEGVTSVPAVCDRQGFAYRLWKSVGFGKPIYRRFDYGKSSLVNFWENKWTDDSQAFFTESGTFKTYQYGGLGRPSNIYSAPQFTTEIANEICPISAFDSATTYRDIPKRCSNVSNASISFKIPAGFLKGDFIFHSINDGDDVTISITGGNGKVKVHSKQNDWSNSVEANGNVFSTARPVYSNFNDPSGIPLRRIFFRKEDINDEVTITITKSSNTAKWLCYWGATYWGVTGRENALHLTTMGRGSRRFNELNNTKSSDILGVHTDILVLENTLINSMGDRNQVLDYRNQFDNLNTFFNANNIPYLLFSPHMTTINANADNFENSKAFHNGVQGYEIEKGKIVFDVNGLIIKVYDTFYKNEYATLSDFIASLMFDMTTHPNEKGFDFYQVACENIL